MPPGMPPGVMQRVPGMPPGIANPGGEGMGIRNAPPARPEQRASAGAGSPMSNVQQRGPQQSPVQRAQRGISDARRPRGA